MENRGLWKHHLWQLEDFPYLRTLPVCRQHWVLLSTGGFRLIWGWSLMWMVRVRGTQGSVGKADA
ncbi:hypothetical protein Taro_040179 [Colocasia esculenta]|uniref:Uncharacterized protein n=1 Tax=Colocasia esculenta TaxID=4460 RepID=A0A843WXR6_COLES|nr:hypothetical protein [Colocasia esculenta]